MHLAGLIKDIEDLLDPRLHAAASNIKILNNLQIDN